MSEQTTSTTTCKTLVLGLTGSVGVLVMPTYVRMFREMLAEHVHVMMSRGAQRFITPYTFELFTGNPVFSDTFDRIGDIKVPHLELSRRADLFLIAPATANVLAKCAHGLCDNLISTAVVACRAPVVFAPSMNEDMWRSRVVRRNVELLRDLGHHILEPSMGIEIADLSPTYGAMPPVFEFIQSLRTILAERRQPSE